MSDTLIRPPNEEAQLASNSKPTPIEPLRPAQVIQARAALWSEARYALMEFVKAELRDQVDYGTITVNGKETKPTLFKPGAEKLLGMMGYTPRFRVDSDTHTMLGSPRETICYLCILRDVTGRVVGEGRGAATVGEGTDKTRNQAIKKAEKRAKVDACLSTLQLTEIFTQDLEDGDLGTTSAPPDSRVFGQGTRESDAEPPPVDWSKARTDRERLTMQIEFMREHMQLGPDDFGKFCRRIWDKIPAQMNKDELTDLHVRMFNKIRETEPQFELNGGSRP